MISLLIIADDFTGALDTGIQFQKRGIRTGVTTDKQCDFSKMDIDVLTVDAETRHLSPEEARRTVFEVVLRAKRAKIPYIYKKTDSALRGNIGAELEGALEAFGDPWVCFVPAYPKAGRTTDQGIQYINAVPVAESVFGNDPFEPVRHSDLEELLGQQTKIPIRKITREEVRNGGIFAHKSDLEIAAVDAVTDEDLEAVSQALSKKIPHLMAGCAGFAEMLPKLLDLPAGSLEKIPEADGLIVCSGSLNPITFRQIRNAVSEGFSKYTLSEKQLLDKAYTVTKDHEIWIQKIINDFSERQRVIIEGEDSNLERTHFPANQNNEKTRKEVAENLGAVYSSLIKRRLSGFYVIVGGDTLFSVLNHLECTEIIPLRELSPGVVLSRIWENGETIYLISKAGGLGSDQVFTEILSALKAG